MPAAPVLDSDPGLSGIMASLLCCQVATLPIEDATKWDARYREGAYQGRAPSTFLIESLALLQSDAGTTGTRVGQAADLGCGRGRNAIYLAAHGFRVDAYDISTAGLEAAAAAATQADVIKQVHWVQRDLVDTGLPAGVAYDLIVVVRFVVPEILRRIGDYLKAGGCLLAEEHLQLPETREGWQQFQDQAAALGAGSVTREQINGPRSQRFRVPPGQLLDCARANGLTVLHHFDGLIMEPDGEIAAVSRLLATRK